MTHHQENIFLAITLLPLAIGMLWGIALNILDDIEQRRNDRECLARSIARSNQR